MDECEDWESMCNAVRASAEFAKDYDLSYFCGDDENNHKPPAMRTYFHFGLEDYALFQTWMARNGAAYFATFVAIVSFGIDVGNGESLASRISWRNEAVRAPTSTKKRALLTNDGNASYF